MKPFSSVLVKFIAAVLLIGFGISLYVTSTDDSTAIRVAFVGNSFQFVNDLPRFVEALSRGWIEHQDSVLHGGLRFETLLTKGNGMYGRWNTSNAILSRTNSTYDDETNYVVYDYGSCTVPQLLLGSDDQLLLYSTGGQQNNDDKDFEYVNDGKNPCFQDDGYLQYTLNEKTFQSWDFVILNDQSMRPAVPQKRQTSIQVLNQSYAPILLESGATPVFFMTWAYWREDINMTDLVVDIPTFTSRLYQGYQQYAEILQLQLPQSQAPRIAPVGLAFLLIYEENYSFWKTQLFGQDNYHPSPAGTYLAGCVIYATLFGRLPPIDIYSSAASMWDHAREMQFSGPDLPLPSKDTAIYLRWIAKRVTLRGHLPNTLSLVDDDGS